MRIVTALISGALFGLGLVVSGMINPAKVLGFLDIAGDWDPSLAVVMAAAIPVAAIGFAAAESRRGPVFSPAFQPPAATAIDARLVGGAMVFGLGWGLAGVCPGPALASLGFGRVRVLIFVAAMVAGMALFRLIDGRLATRTKPPSLSGADLGRSCQ